MGTVRRHIGTGTFDPVIVVGSGGGTAGGTTPSSKDQRSTSTTRGAEGLGVPLVYGYMRVPGILFTTPANVNGNMVLGMAICSGPIQQIVSYDIGGQGQSVAGVSAQVFDGAQATVSSILSGAFPGYTMTHKGRAYCALSVSPMASIFGGLPEAQFVIKGRKDIFDPRTNSVGYSENQALQAAHVVTAPDLGNMPSSMVDWDSVARTANFLDTLIAGEARRSGGLYIADPTNLRDVLNQILGQARIFDVWDNGMFQLRFDDGSALPLVTIDRTWLASTDVPQETTTNIDAQATVVRGAYPIPSRQWENGEEVAYADGVRGGLVPWRESQIQLPGVTSASVAARAVEDTLNDCQAVRRLSVTLKRQASLLQRGDVVAVRNLCAAGNDTAQVINLDPGNLTGGAFIDGASLKL